MFGLPANPVRGAARRPPPDRSLPQFICRGFCTALIVSQLAIPGATGQEMPALTVSAANYASTPRDELVQVVHGKRSDAAPRTLQPLERPQRYVFVPGELYESDLSYEAICLRLSKALARKGYVNAADADGRVIDPDNVDLVLRVNAGARAWLNPVVRTDSLTWRDGMTPRSRGFSLHYSGGDTVWDSRAGGNDLTFASIASNTNANTLSMGGSGGPQSAPPAQRNLAADAKSSEEKSLFGDTRDYHLLVVDAFRHKDLQARRARAKRVWTTFLAIPRAPGQQFSSVLDSMLRHGAAYFGETTRGIDVFPDPAANVTPGPIEVIESDVPATDRRR